MSTGYREIPDAFLTKVTEAEFAEYQMRNGVQVVQHRGRYWTPAVRGFYLPLDFLARLEPGEVSRPTLGCWGYRASVREEVSGLANSCMPMNLLSSLDDYTLENLPAKRRTDLRKCRKLVSIRQLTHSTILEKEAYAIRQSAFYRTRFGALPGPEHCALFAKRLFEGPTVKAVFGGFVDGKLGGFLTAHAIGGVASIDEVCISTEYLATAMGTGIIFDFVQACKQTGGIRDIVYGLHSIEDPRLVKFKEGMGFKTFFAPSHLWMVPGAASLIKWKKPYSYYRLTGEVPVSICPAPIG